MYFKILVFSTLVTILNCVPIKIGQTGNELTNSKNTPQHLKNANIDALGDETKDDRRARTDPVVDPKNIVKYLDEFLNLYYDAYVARYAKVSEDDLRDLKKRTRISNADDEMQADQPVDEDSTFRRISMVPMYQNRSVIFNQTESPMFSRSNFTDIDYIQRSRNSLPNSKGSRSRDDWVVRLKQNILTQIGSHVNSSIPKPDFKINITSLMTNVYNGRNTDDDPVHAEKIRSFYPICEVPKNTDQDLWKDENEEALNLYFNVDYERNATIASATIRLHRIPSDNLTDPFATNERACENSNEDEKLLRITIYWYTKSLRKHRVKKRMCDSKVVTENVKWVELSVKSATKAWNKGRNLGLAVTVEDQDGTSLKASRYFKGASCTVGMPTPRPIPTIIVDAAKKANKLDRDGDPVGHDTIPIVHPDALLLPTLDICTWEFPSDLHDTRYCLLQKIHEQQSNHRIRHQRRLEENSDRMESTRQAAAPDPRSRIVDKQIVITSENVARFNANINR